MKIRKSRKTREQVTLANGLKVELLRLVKRKIQSAKSDETRVKLWHELQREVELTAEAFKLTLKECSVREVDRRTSMLTGPFFTSDEFPVPAAQSGMMFPVVQLELNELSAAVQDNLGDGLLQLWYDLGQEKECIRVIPLTTVYAQEMTDFNWVPVASGDSFPLPHYWNIDPVGEGVQIISGLTSMGVQSHARRIEACYMDLIDDESGWLWTLMKLFLNNTPYKFSNPVKMFGAFYPIHYTAAEVDMNCLINIGDWGASGGAQIFYKTGKGQETQFAFRSCLR